MTNYVLDFKQVRTDNGVEFDTWIKSVTCNWEYIGQYKTINKAHKAVRAMFATGILF